jgi:hypothetical protein
MRLNGSSHAHLSPESSRTCHRLFISKWPTSKSARWRERKGLETAPILKSAAGLRYYVLLQMKTVQNKHISDIKSNGTRQARQVSLCGSTPTKNTCSYVMHLYNGLETGKDWWREAALSAWSSYAKQCLRIAERTECFSVTLKLRSRFLSFT